MACNSLDNDAFYCTFELKNDGFQQRTALVRKVWQTILWTKQPLIIAGWGLKSQGHTSWFRGRKNGKGRVTTLLVTKNSRTLQDPRSIFTGPCRKPATIIYRHKQQLATHSMIAASTLEHVFTVTCCEETASLHPPSASVPSKFQDFSGGVGTPYSGRHDHDRGQFMCKLDHCLQWNTRA